MPEFIAGNHTFSYLLTIECSWDSLIRQAVTRAEPWPGSRAPASKTFTLPGRASVIEEMVIYIHRVSALSWVKCTEQETANGRVICEDRRRRDCPRLRQIKEGLGQAHSHWKCSKRSFRRLPIPSWGKKKVTMLCLKG